MGFKDWETPSDFFAKLNEQFRFTLDAAASHENALCQRYCTVTGTWENRSHLLLLDKRDGLQFPWLEQRVFCNPPYDSSLYQWVSKAAKREAEIAVLLLPPSVDTSWYWDFLRVSPEYAITLFDEWSGVGGEGLEVLFRKGRLKFWKDGKPGPAPRAGNLLAIFKK